MILASSAVARFAATGALVAAGTLILALPGCGGDTAAKAGDPTISTPMTKAPARAESPPTNRRCAKQVGEFLEAMSTLRERLVAGLSYEEYVEEIDAIRARYDEVPVDRLAVDCLVGSGTPGEKAFGKYIDAANAWGDCIGESGCDAPTVEPVLQQQWRVAAHYLDEASRGPAGSS